MSRATAQYEQHASKVPEVTLGLLDHQDRRHDARRDRRRHRHDDAELGLPGRHGDIPLAARRTRHLRRSARETFQPLLYWATIVASTTAGTTMADFADRSLGIGYAGGSLLLLACLMRVLGALVLVARLDLGHDGQHAEGRRRSIGWRSRSRRHWARRSATGRPTPAPRL